MSKIRSKKTKLEELVRKYLFSKGFRYRINDKRYPGTPDIVLPKYHTIIFVNGCFWHGHENCKAAKLPKTNTELWKNKLLNIPHDIRVVALLPLGYPSTIPQPTPRKSLDEVVMWERWRGAGVH